MVKCFFIISVECYCVDTLFQIMFWKEAATALLIRKSPSCKLKKSIELLILQRSGASIFMPGLRVFPGGKVSQIDFSDEWSQLLKQRVQPNTFDFGLHIVSQNAAERPEMIRSSNFNSNTISTNIGFRICALRETFEESGILLCKPITNAVKPIVLPSKLMEWRDKVNQDPAEFLQMCKELELVPDVWSLFEWTNWLTPTHKGGGGNRRFDTMFYIAFVDDVIEADHDDKEIIFSEVCL